MNVEEFITDMRENPKKHLEEIRIDYIYYLLFGFATSFGRSNIPDIDIEFRQKFKGKVVEWAINKHNHHKFLSLHWFHIIQKYTSSESEAVDVFYQLCDEFFAQVRSAMPQEG